MWSRADDRVPVQPVAKRDPIVTTDNLGQIGLPIVRALTEADFLAINSRLSFEARIFLEFMDGARNHPLAGGLERKLKADPRFNAIEGKLVRCGNSAALLDTTKLVAWWLWRANDVGTERADSDLEDFLSSTQLRCLVCLWLLGVETDTDIKFDDDVILRPLERMPDSSHKEEMKRSSQTSLQVFPTPRSALVCVRSTETIKASLPEMSEETQIGEAYKKLYSIAMLMNCIPGICCLPSFYTCYSPEEVPLGPLAGSAGSAPIYDVVPSRLSRMSTLDTGTIEPMLERYHSLNAKKQENLRRALTRFAQSKGRIDSGESALDLGIALETILLTSEHGRKDVPDQLKAHFRLRGSWLVGKTYEERRIAYDLLGKIYDYRSQMAHSGHAYDLSSKQIDEVEKSRSEHTYIAECIFRKYIIDGAPEDWATLILGGLDR